MTVEPTILPSFRSERNSEFGLMTVKVEDSRDTAPPMPKAKFKHLLSEESAAVNTQMAVSIISERRSIE